MPSTPHWPPADGFAIRGAPTPDPTMRLFTSIPPHLAGVANAPGSSATRQEAVVATWHAAGFAPVSVNTAGEHALHPGLKHRIASLGMDAIVVADIDPTTVRNSERVRHLCTFSAFLSAIHDEHPACTVALVNSDVGMASGYRAQDITPTAHAGGCVIGQRLDVSAPPGGEQQSMGAMNVHGFDFLAFPSACVPRLRSMLPAGLRFGMPWWDHYLPLSLLMLGVRPRLAFPGSLWHVRHAPHWSLRGFARNGLAAACQFAATLRAMPPTLPVSTWLQAFNDRFHPAFARNGLDLLARQLIRASLAPPPVIRNRVAVLAGDNVSLLLQAAAAEQPCPPGNAS